MIMVDQLYYPGSSYGSAGFADGIKQVLMPFGPGMSVPVPLPGTFSAAPKNGSFRIPMKPPGLPQACATASPTQDEDLLANNKPRAQYDYAYKVALGLAANTGLSVAQAKGGDEATQLRNAIEATLAIPIPFQLQQDADGAATIRWSCSRPIMANTAPRTT